MNKSTYFVSLERILLLGSIYLAGEALVHLFGIKLINNPFQWGESAITNVNSYMQLWGVGALFFTLMLNHARKHYQRDAFILHYLSWVSIVLSLCLWQMSKIVSNDMTSLQMWLPQYSLWVKLEALLLICFSLFIWYGFRKKYLTTNH